MNVDAFGSWSHTIGRTRSRGTALIAASLLVAACVVVGFAGPVAAGAPSPTVFPVGDDAVVTFLNPSDAEDYASRHMSESADGTVEADDYAGSGYTAYDRWWALRPAGFVIRLVNTPNVEAYRGTAQTAASRLTAITGVPFSVAAGTISGSIDAPATGEIRLGVSSTSPCPGSWAGCGGPSVSGNSIVGGNIWINPLVDGYTAAEKLHVVAHEFGHVAGLLHYDSSFEGQTQIMHSGAYDATDYRSGDSNGLRYTAGQSQDPLGSWELATSPAGGIIRVAGWAFDPSTPSASSSIQVTIIGSGDNIVRQTTVYRSDINTTYGIAGNHGFDFSFATGASGSSLSICLYSTNVGPGTTKDLGCRNLAVAAPDPFGVGDLPTSPAPGTIRVTGWAFDPSSPSASTRITAYVGSESHDLGLTSVYRPDINATYGITGNHGFDFTFATDLTGSVGVAVWAANIGAGQNRVLVTSSVTVAPAGPGFLRVTTTPAVPSQITVDGVIADTWGLAWVKQPPGSHQVCFREVRGYETPDCQTVTVNAQTTTTVTGTFMPHGYLKVSTSPAVPSQIKVDGVPRNNWGMWTDVLPGSHQVCFGAVAGYTPPPCQTVNVSAGSTSNVTGTFTSSSGTALSDVGFLRVTTSPAVPSQISVDGTPADTWGLNWLQLPPGSHEVCFAPVEGYTEPSCTTATITSGATSVITGTFAQRGFLRVILDPPVQGTITIDGDPANDWGNYTDRPTGTYHVCFGPVPGKTAPPCQDPVVTAGNTTTITATYT